MIQMMYHQNILLTNKKIEFKINKSSITNIDQQLNLSPIDDA